MLKLECFICIKCMTYWHQKPLVCKCDGKRFIEANLSNLLICCDVKHIPEKYFRTDFDSEDQLQAFCIMMISQEFPRLRDKVFHPKNENFIPKNEGESKRDYDQRVMRTIARFKAMGLLAGVMDILFPYNGILYKIELKLLKSMNTKNGGLSDEQKKIHTVWDADCPEIPVQICYYPLQVYLYIKLVLKTNLKIAFYGIES